jgi:uncharacterized protein YndB with AHSA1/START domain
MTIHFEHTVDVAADPQKAFAYLDDVSKTPEWLAPCKALDKLSDGPTTVGTRLRYAYKEGRRVKTMDGEVTARALNERLTYRYGDKVFDVVIDFRVAASSAGTRLTHAISITPKSFLGKLVSPLVRRGVPKQTITAMEKLRSLLAS